MIFRTTFACSGTGSHGCSRSATRTTTSPTVVLTIARPVLRSPLGRASEIVERVDLCGCSRWGSKCGCAVLSFDQERSRPAGKCSANAARFSAYR